ncbi:MAG: histidinol dehydrogenase [Betaproteobacteria bacterium]
MASVNIARLTTRAPDFQLRLAALLRFDAAQDQAIADTVKAIIREIRARGDAALLEITARFDQLNAASVAALEISPQALRQAFEDLPDAQRAALTEAAARIKAFHELQRQSSWSHTDSLGNRLGQRISALDRAGLYVPGGKAAYPSSVLMNAIPAKVAGVGELIMVVPTPQGARNPLVLAAAWIAGIDRVFTIGGAQAVAALAYGTSTIPAVDKIVGPGNAYVAEAKRQVFGQVGIDMIAGPSEILVICDGKTDPDWIAMDLFSQAEHDELAQSILLAPDAGFLDAVQSSIDRLIIEMPRQAVIRKSMEGRGALIQVQDLEEACTIASSIAAEHLEISTDQPEHWAEKIRHAGAIFLGRYASESLGDYCAGPNHVLPTMRTARFSSPLGVYDFQKRTSMVEISAQGAQQLGTIAATLAVGEQLPAHARAAELRLTDSRKK